jgi:hypothetical protein
MNIFLGLAKIQSCHELVRRVAHLEISKSSVSFSFLRGSTSRWWLDHLPSKLSNRIHDLSTGIFSQSISSMCCQSLEICGYVQEHEGTLPLGLFDTGVNAIFKQPPDSPCLHKVVKRSSLHRKHVGRFYSLLL